MASKKRSGNRAGDSANGRDRRRQRKPARQRSKRSSGDLVNYRHMHALARPERVRILEILSERVASPKEIAEELNGDLSNVSYHVTVLRDCGLIVEDHAVPRRGAIQRYYRLPAPTLIPPNAWDDLPSGVRKGISPCIVQEFLADASASMEAGVFDDAPGELSWTPLILDARGSEEVGQLARDFLESILDVQANATKRLSKRGTKEAVDAVSATVFLASFLSARSPKEGMKASATKRR